MEKQGETVPVADVAASFQETVARSLTKRAIACALDYNLDTIAVGGGVAANSGLRKNLQLAAAEHNLRVLFPPLKYCTDNAAMIGCAAADHLKSGHTSPLIFPFTVALFPSPLFFSLFRLPHPSSFSPFLSFCLFLPPSVLLLSFLVSVSTFRDTLYTS